MESHSISKIFFFIFNRRTSNSQSKARSLVELVPILFTLFLEFTDLAMWVWRLVCACAIPHVYYCDREFQLLLS